MFSPTPFLPTPLPQHSPNATLPPPPLSSISTSTNHPQLSNILHFHPHPVLLSYLPTTCSPFPTQKILPLLYYLLPSHPHPLPNHANPPPAPSKDLLPSSITYPLSCHLQLSTLTTSHLTCAHLPLPTTSPCTLPNMQPQAPTPQSSSHSQPEPSNPCSLIHPPLTPTLTSNSQPLPPHSLSTASLPINLLPSLPLSF